jgi:hypothetical protein
MMNIYEESTINFWICGVKDTFEVRISLYSYIFDIIFNVGTPSLEARNIRLVNIITYVIEESKLISENMSANVISLPWRRFWVGAGALPLFPDARPFLMGFIGALPFLCRTNCSACADYQRVKRYKISKNLHVFVIFCVYDCNQIR